jgi:hypothetical protein
MGRSGDKVSTASVSYRRADDLSEVAREWSAAGIDERANAVTWRTFRWHRGQKYYSGTYWSSTVGRHVIYESRLELARLLFKPETVQIDQSYLRCGSANPMTGNMSPLTTWRTVSAALRSW